MRFSGWELVIILVIILLLFGARKLPDLARSLGASAKEFRKGVDEGSTEETTAPRPRRRRPRDEDHPEKKIDRRVAVGSMVPTAEARSRRNSSLPVTFAG